MIVELDKKDLIVLCKGTCPGYSLMGLPFVKRNGTFYASHGRWEWKHEDSWKEFEEDLWEYYLTWKEDRV